MDEELSRLLQQMAAGSNAAAQAAERLAATLNQTDVALGGAGKTAASAASGMSSLTGKISPLAAGVNALAQAVMGYISVQMRLTKSVIDFQSTVYDTENVFGNMTDSANRAFEHMTATVEQVGGPFLNFMKMIPVLGSFLEAGGKVVKEAMGIVQAQNQQNMKVLGQSFSAMQNLTGSFGALTLDLTEFSKQASQAGLTSDQFSRMLVNNSKNLSSTFGGSGRAAKVLQDEFEFLTSEGSGLRATFVAMGLSNDDMAEAMAEYANNQRLLGMSQEQIQTQLSQKTLEYQKNLAAISAITGENAKEQQAERKRRLDQANFAAKMEQLAAEGRENEAMALQEAVDAAAKYGPAFEKVAIEQAVYGRAMSAEANRTILTNRALGEATQAAIDGTKGFVGTQTDARKQALEVFQSRDAEIKAGRDATRSMTMLAGLTDSTFINQLGETFVTTRDTIAKTGTMADEFNTALAKLNEGVTGVTAQIAAQDLGQQQQRVETEAGVVASGTSTLEMAQRFLDMARQRDKELVTELTAFTNELTGRMADGLTGDDIRYLARMLGGEDPTAAQETAREQAEAEVKLTTSIEELKKTLDALNISVGLLGPESAKYQMEQIKVYEDRIRELEKGGRESGQAFAPQGPGQRMGGIAIGPESGYTELLHGIEAVVPLPDGKNIPVELMTDAFEEKLSAMISGLTKTDSSTDDRIPQLLSRMIALQEEMTNLQKTNNRTGRSMVRAIS